MVYMWTWKPTPFLFLVFWAVSCVSLTKSWNTVTGYSKTFHRLHTSAPPLGFEPTPTLLCLLPPQKSTRMWTSKGGRCQLANVESTEERVFEQNVPWFFVNVFVLKTRINPISFMYSGPRLSDHSQQRPPSLVWPKNFATATMSTLVSASQRRPPF